MVELLLDPMIRDWVLLPLTGIIIIVQLLRTIVMQIINKPASQEATEVAQRALVARSQRTRMLAGFLTDDSFLNRKAFLIKRKGRGLRAKAEAPMVDPTAAMGPMRTQAVFYLSNIGFLFIVQTLFTGFVLVKLPFAVTSRFRDVTQRDVAHALELLDPSLVTSFSWYMMCLYGCQGIITLVLGGKSGEFADQSAMMMSQMGMGGRQQGWNPKVAYKAERQQLRIVQPGATALRASEAAIARAHRTGVSLEEAAKQEEEIAKAHKGKPKRD